MPGPWRPCSDVFLPVDVWSFQSQTRCQAPGDHEHDRYAEHDHKISISDEMPGPWRPQHPFAGCLCARYFNLRRDARPLATTIVNSVATPFMDFNLRRDARPLATQLAAEPRRCLDEFQSQTRCQAPGDFSIAIAVALRFFISISDEMPGPWRPRKWISVRGLSRKFQSQTRSQAPGDVVGTRNTRA